MSAPAPHSPRLRRLVGWALGSAFAVAIACAILFAVPNFGRRLDAQDPGPAGEQAKRPLAPELDGGVAWLNTAGPLKVVDLRGRIILLDFWTLCCINCIHTLPDLAKLEAKYPGILVVIGIHTPKFPNEKLTATIKKAILRYRVRHPVVNDAEAIIWRRYGITSWPTLVLIDPEGRYVGQAPGEGNYDVLDRYIGQLAKEYRAKKQLNERPLRFQLAGADNGSSPLYFPGKVLADQPSKRLFIADSTHHRIVITSLDGRKIAIAGTGAEGKKDGPFATAQFSDPQGLALDGDTLYVADRKNHSIRALDLKEQKVRTVAGTGMQARERRSGGAALETGLNSPWDVLLHDGKLYIAMAGDHQIWALDLARSRVAPFAGHGKEDLRDGPLAWACFAQPSGLATDGQTLYVADSEISAIRAVPLGGKGEVSTIVGEGLFEFGDVDGEGSKVRLQHALGVAYHDGKLYVADTYNGKIKVIDPATRTCTTLLGEAGGWLKDALFNEPGGLSFAGDKLYVADTNGHRIRVVDVRTRSVSTLNLQGVEAPKMEAAGAGS